MNSQMRRKDRQLAGEEARAILEAGEYGILATVGEDGQPYGTPLSYVVADNSIWFHCAREGRKLRDIAREPRVCFTVVGRTKPVYSGSFTTLYESAMVFGTASRVTDDEAKWRILELLCRKYLPDDMDKFKADVSVSLRVTDIWRISIDVITGKAKRAGRS